VKIIFKYSDQTDRYLAVVKGDDDSVMNLKYLTNEEIADVQEWLDEEPHDVRELFAELEQYSEETNLFQMLQDLVA
jgi:hypothetical protein